MKPYNSGFEPKTSLRQIIADFVGRRSTELHILGSDYEIRLLLLDAIHKKKARQVNKLLKYGIDLNVGNVKYPTVLHEAISYNPRLEIVRDLLHHGSDVHTIDVNGYTVLHQGLISGASVECITELLCCGADANVKCHSGISPLFAALICRADLQVVRALIHHGAQVNSISISGFTLLFNCVFIDVPLQYIKLLLQFGADATLANHLEDTPLHEVLSSETTLPLAKLFVKYTLIRTFVGDSCNHFNLNAYRHLRHYNAAACYFEDCVLELVKMKTTKVNYHISLFAFVTTKNSNTLLYSENENSQIITQEEKIIANYPIYSDIILPRIAYALERGVLFRKLNEVFVYSRNYYGLFKIFGEKVVLNSDCAFTIAKNMSNVDLCNLMLAFSNPNLNNSKSCARISGL